MTMTRKDFENVAVAIRNAKPREKDFEDEVQYTAALNEWYRVVEIVCNAFSVAYERFNPTGFERMCDKE